MGKQIKFKRESLVDYAATRCNEFVAWVSKRDGIWIVKFPGSTSTYPMASFMAAKQLVREVG